MPYINKDKRKLYDKEIKSLIKTLAAQETKEGKFRPGDLNYIITKLGLTYISSLGENYSSYNSFIGILEASKLEIYRTHIAGYEDKAKRKNGVITI